jgi:hypothetical protein
MSVLKQISRENIAELAQAVYPTIVAHMLQDGEYKRQTPSAIYRLAVRESIICAQTFGEEFKKSFITEKKETVQNGEIK